MNKRCFTYNFLLCCFFCYQCTAQLNAYSFRHLTTNDGLSNGVIKAITQDKYGYMWFATSSGVCMYNGYAVKVFFHSDHDTFSIPDNAPLYILCDKHRNIFISFENGLYQYNYNNNRFLLQQKTKGIAIIKMVESEDGIIYCTTSNGLQLFNIFNGNFTLPPVNNNLLKRHISDIAVTKKGTLYAATDTGLIVYQPKLNSAYVQPLSPVTNLYINKLIAVDDGKIWISYGEDRNLLLQTDSSFKQFNIYKDFLFGSANMTGNEITDIFADNKQRLWIATSRSGICVYNNTYKKFTTYLDNAHEPTGLSSFHITIIFQDDEGFIWAGTEGYGLNYFNPDNNLFHSLIPDIDPAFISSDRWFRTSTEDMDGNLWMGSMNGIVFYNQQSAKYTHWQNTEGNKDRLYSNSIRSLLCDNHGNMWIGTAAGLNRYNPSTKHMDFFGGKDSLPQSFFWGFLQDHLGNIWIGCRNGLYRFNYNTNKFDHFENDPLLSVYRNYNIRSMFEDSRQRIWLGCYSKGVVMIDTKQNTVTNWMKNADTNSFINNNVRSFTEDKKGVIWIATNDGLTSYNSETNFLSK